MIIKAITAYRYTDKLQFTARYLLISTIKLN